MARFTHEIELDCYYIEMTVASWEGKGDRPHLWRVIDVWHYPSEGQPRQTDLAEVRLALGKSAAELDEIVADRLEELVDSMEETDYYRTPGGYLI